MRVCLVAGHVCSSRSGAVGSGFVRCGWSHADPMWPTRPHSCVLHAGILHLQRGSSALLRPLGLCSAVSITLACASRYHIMVVLHVMISTQGFAIPVYEMINYNHTK